MSDPTASPILRIDLANADATAALGRRFADLLHPGDLLLLEGPIGAGKTHFARALIQARLARLGRHEDVPSPTFTLVQVYDADPEVWHADLYRLTHPDEAIELGLEEAFDTAICLVEWPDRLGEMIPKKALFLRFSSVNEGESRQVELFGNDDWLRRLDAWKKG